MKQVQGVNTKREKDSSKWETGCRSVLAGYQRAEEGFCNNFSEKVVRTSRSSNFEPSSCKSFQSTPEGRQCISGACKGRALAATEQVVSSTQINLCKLMVRRFISSKRNIIFSLKCFYYMPDKTIVLILFLLKYFNPDSRKQNNPGLMKEMLSGITQSLTTSSTT